MLMALLVLVGFGFMFMFATDENGGNESIEAVIARNTNEIGSYQASLVHAKGKMDGAPVRNSNASELAKLKREAVLLKEKIGGLQKSVEAKNAELARKHEEFEGYKDEYRAFARAKAKGEKMESLTTLSGAVYKDVNIREVTAIGMQIRHEEGQKRIPFEDLPAELKDRFQFDPKQKEKAIAQETVERSEHEAAVGVANIEMEKQLAARRQVESEADKEKSRHEIAQKQSRISSLESEIENLNEAIRLESMKKLSRAGIMQGQIANKRQEIADLQSQISNLQSRL